MLLSRRPTSSRQQRPSAIAERELDHDRRVALGQLPASVRSAFSTLWALDLAFADIVATSTDPRIGEIRMAWWREHLEQLDQGQPAPAEPRLQAVADELRPRGLSGRELSRLEDAWLPLLEPFPWGDLQEEGLALRGRILFGAGARLLGEQSNGPQRAGALWSLVDGATHSSDPHSRTLLLERARRLPPFIDYKPPRHIRPLTVLSALAEDDLKGDGNRLRRVFVAIRHLLFGTFPGR